MLLLLVLVLNMALVGAAVAPIVPIAWGPHCWSAGYLDNHKVRECSDGMWFIDYEVEGRGFGYSYPLVKQEKEGLWLTTSDLTDARAAEQADTSSISPTLALSGSVRSAETHGGPTPSSTSDDGSLGSSGSAPQPETVAPPSCYVADLDAPCVTMPPAMLQDAYAVINCESRHNRLAISATGDWGLFQLNRYWQERRANRMGYDWSEMREVRPNVAVATAIFEEQGWGPWSCRP